MRIIVLGAGIAGLSLAHELHRRGLDDVTVLERTRAFEHVGGGIHLGPWGMSVLESNGVADAVREHGVPYSVRSYFDASGTPLGTVDLGALVARYGGSLGVYCHRADLHAALAEVVPQGLVQRGVQVTAIREETGGIRLETESHGTFDGDLLVGCDGLHSQARRHLLGVTEVPLAKRALRTVLPSPHAEVGVEIYRGIGSTVGIGRIDRRASLYVWTHTPTRMGSSVSPDRDPADELLELFATYGAARMRELAELVPDATVTATDLHEVIVPTPWRGRVALAGDAAHAMSPSAGLGGTMAFEDAAVLAGELADVVRAREPLEVALDRYARRRLPRVEAVRAQARYTDYDGQIASPDLCRVRDARFARLLAKPEAFASEVTGALDLGAGP